jgi:pimeloyl-ACP methyl ester carboxylesterase
MRRVLSRVTFVLGGLLIGAVAAESAPLDPTTVVVTGVKRQRPTANEAPPPVDTFTRDSRFELIAISGDGQKVASVVRFNDRGIQDGHKLVIYSSGIDQVEEVELDSTPYDGVYWIDEHTIALTRSASGRKGTCPDLDGDTGRRAEKLMNLLAADSAVQTMAKPEDAGSFRSNLTPLQCRDYGIRQYSITATVDLTTKVVGFIGKKMGENRQLGTDTVKPIKEGSASALMGAFVDLSDKVSGGVFSERIYLWKVDPTSGRGRIVDDGGGDSDRTSAYVDDWLFDKNGRIVARSYYNVLTESYVIAALHDGKWKTLLSKKFNYADGVIAPFIAGVGRDGSSILIVLADRDPKKTYHYRELSNAGELTEPLDLISATREVPIFAPSDGRLAGFMMPGTQPKYRLFDPVMQKIYDAAQDFSPSDSVEVVSTALDDARKMVLKVKGRTDVGQYFYVDFSKGSYRNLGTDHPDLRPEWTGLTTEYDYRTRDGIDLEAVLTIPSTDEEGARPLVVLPHDSPSTHDSLQYDWLPQLLASRGYIVFQPNYRGSDIYSEKLNRTSNGQTGKILDDIEDGVQSLVSEHLIDPSRVCVAGKGFGGYAALMLASRVTANYRCVIAIGPFTDIPRFKGNLASRRRMTPDPSIKPRLNPGRTIEANHDDLSSYEILWPNLNRSMPSPEASVVDSRSPLLFLQMQADPLVGTDDGAEVLKRAADRSLYSSFKVLSGCDRDIITQQCKNLVAKEVLDFIKNVNP